MSEQQKRPYAEWSILELMGHRRLAGFVREVELAGAGVLRIDIPGPDGGIVATQYYPPASMYGLTPVGEDIARAVAAANQPQPVQRWELPAPAPADDGAGDLDPLGVRGDAPEPWEDPHNDPYDDERSL